MKKINFSAVVLFLCAAAPTSQGLIIGTTGTAQETNVLYPPESDTTVFVFNEQQDFAFVASQPLDFGTIDPGTRVNSHYLQLDTVSPTGAVQAGSVTFDGPILGIITSTSNLFADLSPDSAGTSDSYFGFESTLGTYPVDADAADRGLGSPQDDLNITIGSDTLSYDSLEISTGNRVDGIRVLTLVPEPGSLALLAMGGLALIHRRQ